MVCTTPPVWCAPPFPWHVFTLTSVLPTCDGYEPLIHLSITLLMCLTQPFIFYLWVALFISVCLVDIIQFVGVIKWILRGNFKERFTFFILGRRPHSKCFVVLGSSDCLPALPVSCESSCSWLLPMYVVPGFVFVPLSAGSVVLDIFMYRSYTWKKFCFVLVLFFGIVAVS